MCKNQRLINAFSNTFNGVQKLPMDGIFLKRFLLTFPTAFPQGAQWLYVLYSDSQRLSQCFIRGVLVIIGEKCLFELRHHDTILSGVVELTRPQNYQEIR